MSTSRVSTDHLEHGRLGRVGDQLGQGGQAIVYRLPELQLPDVQGPLVYKEYRAQHAPPGGLARVVTVRNRLDPGRRKRLDEIAAWPVRIVTHAGVVRGVVLPCIPDSFFQGIELLGTGGRKRITREVQHLFVAPHLAKRIGMPVADRAGRLAVCRDFAAALAFLHDELNVVFGDVNAKNELFRLTAEPRVMLVDCDAVRISGSAAVVRQLNAPDWDPPEPGPLNRLTDLYKLGLFVLRSLTPGDFTSLSRDPAAAAGEIDAAGMTLLWRAITGPPAQRPAAAEWYRYFRRCLGQAVAPPHLQSAWIDRVAIMPGEPVAVTWAAPEASTLHVTGPAVDMRLDARQGNGIVLVYPAGSGAIRLVVSNEFGTESRVVGPVTVVAPPPVRPLTPVPMPGLTWAGFPSLSLPPIDIVSAIASAPSIHEGAFPRGEVIR